MPPLIYLDHASTSWPKATGVAEAIASAVADPLTTPGRGLHALAHASARIRSAVRESLAPVVGTDDPDRIVLTSGATESLNIAVLGVLAHRTDCPRVVTTSIEHNALRRPLESLAARGIIELVSVPADSECRAAPAELLDAIHDRTSLVAMTHASNVTGTIEPIEAVAEALRARRRAGRPTPLFLLDASQTAGLLPLDVERMGIDLAAFSGHKALGGPAGTGVLYVGPAAYSNEATATPLLQPLRPVLMGGTGQDSLDTDMPATLPARFEPGTPNTPGLAGLLAALRPWSPTSAARRLARERALLDQLRASVTDLNPELVRFHGPADPNARVSALSLSIPGLDPAEFAGSLEHAFGIITRSGFHCAPGAHAAIHTLHEGGTVRVSPGPNTTVAEIETTAQAILQLARALKR